MYLRDGLTPEQIAGALDLDLVAVEMVLASSREAANKEDEKTGRSVKKDLEVHREAFIAALGELASCAENEGVRVRAATVGLEFLHGQRDPKRVMPQVSGPSVHIVIQQAAERARVIKEAAKRGELAPVTKVVDV